MNHTYLLAFLHWRFAAIPFDTFCFKWTSFTFTALIYRDGSFVATCCFFSFFILCRQHFPIPAKISILFFIILHVFHAASNFCKDQRVPFPPQRHSVSGPDHLPGLKFLNPAEVLFDNKKKVKYNLLVKYLDFAYLYFTLGARLCETWLLYFCMQKELRTNLVRQPPSFNNQNCSGGILNFPIIISSSCAWPESSSLAAALCSAVAELVCTTLEIWSIPCVTCVMASA